MNWDKLSKSQKSLVSSLQQQLKKAGVMESVSQVAKYLDDAAEWGRDDITLATLCDRTGWTMPDPTEERESIHTMQLPTGVLRHVRKVLEEHGSKESLEALELLPEAVTH